MNFPDAKHETTNSGTFVKLGDGEKIIGLFRGDPVIFKIHWIDRKSTACTGEGCQLCKNGDKAKFRFRINIITKQDGVYVAKIFEGNYGTYKDLKSMHEENYNLAETLVTITRQGQKQNTRYSVLPVKDNGGLTDEKMQALLKIPLNALAKESQKREASDNVDPFDEAM